MKIRSVSYAGTIAQREGPAPGTLPQVAFSGRSNVGKSSLINTLLQRTRSKIAHVSAKPGKTQALNFYEVNTQFYLVDLPGYGYAKVPEQMKKDWQATLDQYLQTRNCLRGIILVMDIRHPLKPFDQMMLDWAHHCQLPIHLLLNKSDKLKRGPGKSTLLALKKHLKEYGELASVQLFSALKRDGAIECLSVLDRWFDLENSEDDAQ